MLGEIHPRMVTWGESIYQNLSSVFAAEGWDSERINDEGVTVGIRLMRGTRSIGYHFPDDGLPFLAGGAVDYATLVLWIRQVIVIDLEHYAPRDGFTPAELIDKIWKAPVSTVEKLADGAEKSADEGEESNILPAGWMDWAKENPLLLAGGAAAVLFFVMGRGK